MIKFKIPGVSFSLNRALGITQAKQKFARETGISTSKAGLEEKSGRWSSMSSSVKSIRR